MNIQGSFAVTSRSKTPRLQVRSSDPTWCDVVRCGPIWFDAIRCGSDAVINHTLSSYACTERTAVSL